MKASEVFALKPRAIEPGDVIVIDGSRYLVCIPEPLKICLANMETGNRWNSYPVYAPGEIRAHKAKELLGFAWTTAKCNGELVKRMYSPRNRLRIGDVILVPGAGEYLLSLTSGRLVSLINIEEGTFWGSTKVADPYEITEKEFSNLLIGTLIETVEVIFREERKGHAGI